MFSPFSKHLWNLFYFIFQNLKFCWETFLTVLGNPKEKSVSFLNFIDKTKTTNFSSYFYTSFNHTLKAISHHNSALFFCFVIDKLYSSFAVFCLYNIVFFIFITYYNVSPLYFVVISQWSALNNLIRKMARFSHPKLTNCQTFFCNKSQSKNCAYLFHQFYNSRNFGSLGNLDT